MLRADRNGVWRVLRLYPAEKTILMIVAAIGFSAVVLAETKGIAVDYALFVQPALAASVFIMLGQVLRKTWNAERPALLTTLIGIFAFDAMVFSTYNVMLLPRHMAPPLLALRLRSCPARCLCRSLTIRSPKPPACP